MDTFALHPLWAKHGSPVQPIEPTELPQDLTGVAGMFADALTHLRRGELTAGTELATTALSRFNSLLGDPDPLPMSLPPARDDSPVLTVSPSDLRRRIAGLSKRGVPLYVAVDNAVTGEVLARLDVTT